MHYAVMIRFILHSCVVIFFDFVLILPFYKIDSRTCSHHECGSASCSALILGLFSKNFSTSLLNVDSPWRMSHTRGRDARLAARHRRFTNKPTQVPANTIIVAFMHTQHATINSCIILTTVTRRGKICRAVNPFLTIFLIRMWACVNV